MVLGYEGVQEEDVKRAFDIAFSPEVHHIDTRTALLVDWLLKRNGSREQPPTVKAADQGENISCLDVINSWIWSHWLEEINSCP